jgi:ribulokinase
MMPGRSPLFLAVDFGTESARAAVFNAEGRLVLTEAAQYPTRFPQAGWAEQKPSDWMDSFTLAVRKLVGRLKEELGELPESILSIAVDGTSCTVLALGADRAPLRNALLWMDVRAFEQADRIARSGAEALKYNGFGSVSAEWMPPKVLWLKEKEPEIFGRARVFCELQDWVNLRITGDLVASINNVTVRWYYDRRSGGWPGDFYESIGLGDVVERFPRRVLALGEPIGTLRPEMADATGLSRKTVVVQGGADAYIGVLGLGAVRAGRVALITGSSHLFLGHSGKEFHRKGIFGAFPDAVMPGLFVVEGGHNSTGSVLKWFKDNFICKSYEEEAARLGLGLYEHLSGLAEQIKIGSEGLVVLNYWQGNRNPLTDAQARGVIWGLSLKHTPVHLYRAIMEAVCYGMEHIMRCFRDAGYAPGEIFACGGATKSRLWMQMQSDVLGIPIFLTEESNAPLLGGAILASYGSGVYGSIEAAADRMVKIRDRIEPDLANTEKYRFYADKYIATYPQMKDLMHDMLDHETHAE